MVTAILKFACRHVDCGAFINNKRPVIQTQDVICATVVNLLMMAASLVGLVTALLGYPDNLQDRFFESVDATPMGQPGVFDGNILDTSSRPLRIRCQGSGVICVGDFEGLSEGGRNLRFADRWDVRRQTNDVLTVHLGATGGVGVSVVCARYGVTWRHASWSPSSGTYDVFGGINKSVDFLVVGGGVGGWAAAAALRGESNVALVRPPNTVSTTERSSGVMWFPSAGEHTPEVLRNATGTSQFDDILTKYAQSGEQDRQYWDDLIGLRPWPSAADPVGDYMGVSRNRSFVLSECCGSGDQLRTCIAQTTNLSPAQYNVIYNAIAAALTIDNQVRSVMAAQCIYILCVYIIRYVC